MPIVEKSVTSLQELTGYVIELGNRLPDGRFLWYRGLTCADYQLLPKIMRDGKSAEDVFERENRLLTRFRQRSVPYWPAGYPQSNWEHLFAMQHYGMPTRLLDWSENLFVAAHFALMDAPDHSSRHTNDCIPAIWCVDPVEWNRASPVLDQFGESIHVLTTVDEDLAPYEPMSSKRRYKHPLAMFGTHNSSRIVAQRGTFITWGDDTRPLEVMAAEPAFKATLWKINLTAPREELAEGLRLLGFSETMVFPELPSLGTELARAEGWPT